MKNAIQKAIKKGTDFIFNKTHSCVGGGESTDVTIVINVSRGETYVKVHHEISETFEIKDYNKAVDLYDRLTCGSGRKMYKPSDLAHPYNPKK